MKIKKSKAVMASMLAFALVASTVPAVSQANEGQGISLSLNGQTVGLSARPELVGSTLMVPLRDVSEALGVSVEWNEETQTAIATKGESSIRLTLGSSEAARGANTVALPEKPVMHNGNLLVPLRFFSESFDFNVYWDAFSQSVSIVDADKSLPTVGSVTRLEELLKDFGTNGSRAQFTLSASDQALSAEAPSASVQASTTAAQSKQATENAGGSGVTYSGTNVQVEGVDEADIIKTDGSYIYQVNRDRVLVTSAIPAENMSVISAVYWNDANFSPRELYVDGKHLIVIGTTSHPDPNAQANPDQPSEIVPVVKKGVPLQAIPTTPAIRKIVGGPIQQRRFTTKAIVYDLADRSHLQPVRETELEGHYLSSRKIGDELYLITNKHINTFGLMRPELTAAEKEAIAAPPAFRDSKLGEAFHTIGFEDIRYFPKASQPNYLVIGGFDLSDSASRFQVTSYLGSGQNVYASTDNLYVTVNEYEPVQTDPLALMPPSWTPSSVMTSTIYKFALKQGTVQYTGRGKVPGHPLNQFSMDEHNGYFRIATTKGDIWRTDENTSKNNIYVLDETMTITGKLEDLAPGERIYSVRYAGNRAYMVTFRNVDPLYVIDLNDPSQPTILGQLKIPGYSDYLHPYDENHLIGFGKEAVEVPNKNKSGPETNALYQGMKIAMFDVSDINQPQELFKETIGDRGTQSDLLHNHKALLFSKEKNLMAFPVTVMEIKNKSASDAAAYGEFTFQGAYVYKIDLEKGFQLRGKVTHLTNDDLAKAGKWGYDSGRNISRLLYINDILYSSSPDMLKANRLSDLQEVGSLQLPPWQPKQQPSDPNR